MRKAWLHCQVQPGMFSDERVVRVKTTDGHVRSYFVESSAVSDDKVCVELVERSGVQWALLPTDHPYSPIPVRDEDLDAGNGGAVCG